MLHTQFKFFFKCELQVFCPETIWPRSPLQYVWRQLNDPCWAVIKKKYPLNTSRFSSKSQSSNAIAYAIHLNIFRPLCFIRTSYNWLRADKFASLLIRFVFTHRHSIARSFTYFYAREKERATYLIIFT